MYEWTFNTNFGVTRSPNRNYNLACNHNVKEIFDATRYVEGTPRADSAPRQREDPVYVA